MMGMTDSAVNTAWLITYGVQVNTPRGLACRRLSKSYGQPCLHRKASASSLPIGALVGAVGGRRDTKCPLRFTLQVAR